MEIDIDKLRELHAATTQGEWTNRWRGKVTTDVGYIADCDVSGEGHKQHQNSVFISAAHNAIPSLLDEMESLRDANNKLRDALQELLDFSDVLNGTHYASSMKVRFKVRALLKQKADSEN